MNRLLLLVVASFWAGLFLMASPLGADPSAAAGPPGQTASSQKHLTPAAGSFSGRFTGSVIYYSPAGFEPDFDLIDRVIFETRVTSKSLPPMTLILDAYLENFQVDTTPVLPDLIHPKTLLSSSLGGFFSGKAIIVGAGNKPLFVGAMLAEAFIQPRGVQHMILVQMLGHGSATGGKAQLNSVFTASKKFHISGSLYGTLKMPQAAVVALRHGSSRLTAKQVLKDFQVQKPAQRGTSGTGTRTKGYCFQGHCTNQGTGKGSKPGSTGTGSHPSSGSGRPAWITVLGIGLIALAFVLLGVFFLLPKGSRDSNISTGDEPANPDKG